MSRATQTWIIVGALFISVAALVYFFRPLQSEPAISAPAVPQGIPEQESHSPEPVATPEPPLRAVPAVGTQEIEKFENVTFVFRRTGNTRKLVEFRTPATSKDEDGSCSDPYVARERVSKVTYAYGFIIDKFNTWNEKEGQQEYLPFESDLPRIYQGGLHDIVHEGRTVTVTKQRCGMGQVEALVAVAS